MLTICYVLFCYAYMIFFCGSMSLKQKGRHGDYTGLYRKRWSQASTSPVNAGAVTLTTFRFLCGIYLHTSSSAVLLALGHSFHQCKWSNPEEYEQNRSILYQNKTQQNVNRVYKGTCQPAPVAVARTLSTIVVPCRVVKFLQFIWIQTVSSTCRFQLRVPNLHMSRSELT